MTDAVDWTQYLLAMLVLAGLLGLLGLFAMAVQRGWILQGVTGLAGFKPDERRMKIRETLVLDPRRRMVIVEVDDEEHLLLLGATNETLVKTQPAAPRPAAVEEMPDA
ncbi:flagellar biosynthetic protein FliO [Maricaulis sp.]|uniref:flagellar biosynthetic protein FliO n=1 Tax=Maricaulis sp. TaxID=1486257 RepID=UPI002601F964|nr:flagellar biosynthetic protein FliO [Maricaulis sp.]